MRLAAAVVAALLVLAHSYLGERYILIRLFRRDDLPKLFGGTRFTKDTLRFAWHITSVAWLGLGALLAIPSAPPHRVVAVTFAASGLVALVASRGRHLSWVAFFAIAALAWP